MKTLMQKHLTRWQTRLQFVTFMTALVIGLPSTSAFAAISAKCLSETPASTNVVGAISGGNVFGNPSGGYSTDSDLNVAAVHAGLVAPGASAYIAVTPLDTLSSFTGTTANGVTTRSYPNPWCGMRLAVSTPSGKPLPTIKVQYNASPLVANASFTLNWMTTNTTLLERVCTAASGGFESAKQSMSLDASGNGTLGGTASPAWVGKPSSCTWTATGPGGSVDLQETRTTISDVPTIPPNTLPTISVQHTPSPMIAGQNFTLRWSTTNALDVTLECTSASSKGFNFAKTSMGGVNDATSTTALASWIGNPSTCIWTATNAYGSKTFSETWTTVASTTPAPTIEVKYSSMPLLAGSDFTLNWKTTNATSLTRVCTSEGTGFKSSLQPMTLPESSLNSTASSGWIGYPSTCTWVASGPGGSKTLTEIRTTVATLPPQPQLTVQYAPTSLVAGQTFSINWSSSNTTAVAYDCKSASGNGSFNGQGGATGSVSRTADASWVASPLVCSWRADGDGGSKYQSDTLTTSAAKETITFFHNDVAGSPLMASDASGNVVWKENYLPYGGKLTNQASSKDNSVGYAGSPFDQTTGLSYMGARYYDPVIGRFMGIDPVDFRPENIHSFNRYTYANNNPYRFKDPNGRSALDIGFLAYDAFELGVAIYSGVGVAPALANVGLSLVGVASPIPGTGQFLKGLRGIEHAAEIINNAEKVVSVAKNGETTATRLGKEAHKMWDAGKGFEKEVTLPSGKRADAVNFAEQHVKELKPDNARAVKFGEKQVESYRKELQSEYGGNWTSSVETYRN